MQCKDISSKAIIKFLQIYGGIGCNSFGNNYERSVTRAIPDNTPPNLVRAKLYQMISKGLITGCTCGCRGDFENTPKGLALLEGTS